MFKNYFKLGSLQACSTKRFTTFTLETTQLGGPRVTKTLCRCQRDLVAYHAATDVLCPRSKLQPW